MRDGCEVTAAQKSFQTTGPLCSDSRIGNSQQQRQWWRSARTLTMPRHAFARLLASPTLPAHAADTPRHCRPPSATAAAPATVPAASRVQRPPGPPLCQRSARTLTMPRHAFARLLASPTLPAHAAHHSASQPAQRRQPFRRPDRRSDSHGCGARPGVRARVPGPGSGLQCAVR